MDTHSTAVLEHNVRTETLGALRAHRMQLMDRVVLLERQQAAHLETISHLVRELHEAYSGPISLHYWHS
ncbi:hypothetical protein H4R21_005062 [Coemansia helicoidea]|uniref:Uncharacterized protein n=1 Tax=Coemansia helicoidea TaxID=1286919 RepID=A0ACC1KV66_9FUNG|nr:hypothetical protein H4R21_005062 [Coemansia helicoidea]